jgi:hypothetical protein
MFKLGELNFDKWLTIIIGILIIIFLIITIMILLNPVKNFVFAGIGTDGIIYTSPSINGNSTWNKTSSVTPLSSLIQLNDNTFAGIGKDNKIYISPSINTSSKWTCKSNDTGLKIDCLIQLRDFTFACVGITDATDDSKNKVYRTDSTTLTTSNTWTPQKNTSGVIWILELKDKTFVGINNSYQICTSKTLGSDGTTNVWVPTGANIKLISLTQLDDGSFAGIGTDNMIYTSPTISKDSTWTIQNNNTKLVSITSVLLP